jgi:uncharacterized ubiquitin-like protein YukD
MEITKYKTSLVIYIFILTLAIVALPFLSSFLIRYVSYDFQASLDKTQKLDSFSTISQTFTARAKNLIAIGMSIKNPNFTNKTDVIIQIYDQNKIKLGESVLKGDNIADGDFVKFNLTGVHLEVGKKYYFTLTSPATPEEHPYGIYISDSSSQDNHFMNEVEDKGAVSFVVFYKPDSHLALAVDIYKKWFKKFAADKPFLFFYSVSLISLATLLIFKNKSN